MLRAVNIANIESLAQMVLEFLLSRFQHSLKTLLKSNSSRGKLIRVIPSRSIKDHCFALVALGICLYSHRECIEILLRHLAHPKFAYSGTHDANSDISLPFLLIESLEGRVIEISTPNPWNYYKFILRLLTHHRAF